MLHFKSIWYTFSISKKACDRSKCSFDTFNSKQIDKTSIAEIFGLQSRQSIYELTTINLTNPPYQLELFIESSNSDEDTKI